MRAFNLILLVFLCVISFNVAFSEEEKQNDELVTCPNGSDCNGVMDNTDVKEGKELAPESVPIESVSENIESVSKPLGKSSEGIESISNTVESLSKPLDSVSMPLGAVSHPIGTVSKPIEFYSVPIESMVGSSANDSEDNQESKDKENSIDGIMNYRNSEEMEDITWEEIAPPLEENDALEVDSTEDEMMEPSINEYEVIDGTKKSYCKWTDEDGIVHIESGRKCPGE